MNWFKFSIFSLHFFIIFFFLVSTKGSAPIPFTKERVSLLSFKSGVVSDPEGFLESWNSSSFDVCIWSGVYCNGSSHQIVQLDLTGLSLRGTISPSLANLSSLRILDLSRNLFEGNIPIELGYLSQLEQLSLSSNLLQGNIPHELGYLTQLVYLDLYSNKFIGEIPLPIFCNGSSSLEYIDLSNNSLSGEIPLKNDCELKELKFLLLWSNKLAGQVPLSLSNSSKLQWLDLESNMLSGELPSQIVQKMPELQVLYLSYNDFVSTNLEPLFTSLVNSSNVQELELAGNNLSGTIPPIIGNLSALVEIHLDENLLFGTIPQELCHLGKLEFVYLSNNSLSGEIPSALGNISHLRFLDLSSNQLEGAIPHSLAKCKNLIILNLGNNKFKGSFPYWLQNLARLRVLVLHHNRLHGRIQLPGAPYSFSSLLIFDLSHNNFTGPLPTAYFQQFKAMMESKNGEYYEIHATVTIKGVEFYLEKVLDIFAMIDLSNNQFQGKISENIGGLLSLKGLNVSHNHLTGHIPKEMGNLSNLEGLDLSSNELVGGIPVELADLTFLEVLNLANNELSGPIPQGKQFNTFGIESYEGNKGLCGFPLPKACSSDSEQPFKEEKSDEPSQFSFEWDIVLIGYGCGLVVGLCFGYIVFQTEKPEWFVKRLEGILSQKLNRLKKINHANGRNRF